MNLRKYASSRSIDPKKSAKDTKPSADLMSSNLKCGALINLFSFFKFRINLLELSGFSTRKYNEMNCPSQSSHSSIAAYVSNF